MSARTDGSPSSEGGPAHCARTDREPTSFERGDRTIALGYRFLTDPTLDADEFRLLLAVCGTSPDGAVSPAGTRTLAEWSNFRDQETGEVSIQRAQRAVRRLIAKKRLQRRTDGKQGFVIVGPRPGSKPLPPTSDPANGKLPS